MMRSYITKKHIVEFLISLVVIYIITACEKQEQYASASINGVAYIEIKTSMLPFLERSPPSIRVWENYNVALYHTLLTPVAGGSPYFDIHFWIALEDDPILTIGKSYKILSIKSPIVYDWIASITQLKEKLPTGYNGVVYCYKEGDTESVLVNGEIKLERFDANEGYYYGSYKLVSSSVMNDKLTIVANFKVVEERSLLTY